MRFKKSILHIILILFFAGGAIGQQTAVTSETEATQDTSKGKGLVVDGANSQFFDASGEQEKLYLRGDVRLTHDSIFMFCDTAMITGNDMHAKGNISIIKNDSIKIFSDSLLYRGDSLMAYFIGNVVVEDGDQQLFTSFLQYDLERDWAIYTDTALLISSTMKLKSKRGILHAKEDYINFYEKVTIEGEDFNLLSDSLRYYTALEKAVFLSPTIINQDGKKIYSESGYYDMKNKKSKFIGNAQFVDGDAISTADTIFNDETKNLVELIGNAKYKSPTEDGRAEKIIYDKQKDEIELIGNAFFKNEESEVTGERIFYDKKLDDVKVSGRSYLSKPPMIIIADDLDYRKSEGIAYANGNVVWQDTSSNYEIICDHATYTDSTDYMKSFNDEGKPLLKNEISEGDTLFLSGDTLISFTEIVEVDTFRYFTAFEHVEMLNEEMQAIGDSLIYNGQDSTFTLYGKPVMWSDSSQFNSDTIIITMVKNEIDQVELIENALILQTSDLVYYDQIKGNHINAYFSNDNLDKMRVLGGSQSVYYMKDEEKAYMGVNETTCSNMTFLFEDNELIQTRFYVEPVSKLTPMNMADHEAIKLPGFKWLLHKRPLIVEDLFF